jgi:hypothetical protein
MNGYVIALLAWLGFSPVLGVAVGTFLRRADEAPRRLGDPSLNVGRPKGVPYVITNQVVAAKRAGGRIPV